MLSLVRTSILMLLALIPAAADQPLVDAQKESGSVSRLPSWMKMSADLRGRVESHGASLGYLGRIRMNLDLSPASWIRMYVQANDSRTAADAPASIRNPVDFRQGFLEMRRSGLSVRAGRQELGFGDESLVGNDAEWCNLGRSFDALTAAYERGRMTVRAFSGRMVLANDDSMDRSSSGRRLSGVQAGFRATGNVSIQPFVLWKNTSGVVDRSIYTAGAFVSGSSAQWQYTSQVAWQRGTVTGAQSNARAAAVRAGRAILRGDRAPRAFGSFRWASGASGSRGTAFDDLYPSGYNAAGLVDPFAWRNLRELTVGGEWPIARRMRVIVEHRWYWLSSLADGLYTDDGAAVATNTSATSSHIGKGLIAGAEVRLTETVRWHTGYGWLRAGPWLRTTDYAGAGSTAFIACTRSF